MAFTDNTLYQTAESLVGQLLPLIEPTFIPAQDPQQQRQLSKLTFRIVYKQLCQHDTRGGQKPEYNRLSEKVLHDLVRLLPAVEIEDSSLRKIVKDIADVLCNHPYNALKEYGFSYVNPRAC